MKIAIIGSGGIGGYFGGMLANAGYDVSFLARGEHLRTIVQNGLQVNSINGNFHLSNVNITDNLSEIGKADLIILSLKAWQLKEIYEELFQMIHKDTLILPLQNGISIIGELQEKIDDSNIIGGACWIMSKIESPGVINHFGANPTIVFGELTGQKTTRLLEIQKIFTISKIHTIISDDILVDLWKKFTWICIGGLVAITRSTYGELREIGELR